MTLSIMVLDTECCYAHCHLLCAANKPLMMSVSRQNVVRLGVEAPGQIETNQSILVLTGVEKVLWYLSELRYF